MGLPYPFANNFLKYLYQFYDPPHMLKNIRNNWTTEKTQTLEFKDPNSGEVVHAKWAHLKQIYNEEVNHLVKRTNLDYHSIYPNNFEKQKVSLVLNVFNEKTVTVLKQKK